jgi:hypothetical protein
MLTLLSAAQTSPLVYPQPKRGDQVDDYHGVKVADPTAGWKTQTPPKPTTGSMPRIN